MKKTIQTQMTLLSSTGKTVVPVKLDYVDDEDDKNPMSEIQLMHMGEKFLCFTIAMILSGKVQTPIHIMIIQII